MTTTTTTDPIAALAAEAARLRAEATTARAAAHEAAEHSTGEALAAEDAAADDHDTHGAYLAALAGVMPGHRGEQVATTLARWRTAADTLREVREDATRAAAEAGTLDERAREAEAAATHAEAAVVEARDLAAALRYLARMAGVRPGWADAEPTGADAHYAAVVAALHPDAAPSLTARRAAVDTLTAEDADDADTYLAPEDRR